MNDVTYSQNCVTVGSRNQLTFVAERAVTNHNHSGISNYKYIILKQKVHAMNDWQALKPANVLHVTETMSAYLKTQHQEIKSRTCYMRLLYYISPQFIFVIGPLYSGSII